MSEALVSTDWSMDAALLSDLLLQVDSVRNLRLLDMAWDSRASLSSDLSDLYDVRYSLPLASSETNLKSCKH